MNEVLAIIVFVFFAEQIKSNETYTKYTLEEAQELSDDQIIEILFDSKHIYADIFWCFERIMALGVKYLYQVTKDIATLRAEITKNSDHPANS
jgi:hypothetical protein